MTHVRGVHETGGFRKLRIAGRAGSAGERSKLTAELSRLDHQRTLVERQLAVWTEKQQVTKHRLGLLDKEIVKIGRLIREFAGPYRAVNRRKRTRPVKSGRPPAGGAAAVPRSDLSLEY